MVGKGRKEDSANGKGSKKRGWLVGQTDGTSFLPTTSLNGALQGGCWLQAKGLVGAPGLSQQCCNL